MHFLWMVHVLPLVTGRVPFSAAIASSLCLPPSSIALVIHLNVCTAPVYNAGLGRLYDRPIERPVCAPICLLNQVGKKTLIRYLSCSWNCVVQVELEWTLHWVLAASCSSYFFLFQVLGDSKYVTSLYFPAILVGLTIESRFVVGRRD